MAESQKAVIRDTALATAVRCSGCHDLLGDNAGVYVYFDWVLPGDLELYGWKVSVTIDEAGAALVGKGRWVETVYFHCPACVAEGRPYPDEPHNGTDMLLGNIEVGIAFDPDGTARIAYAEADDEEEGDGG